MKFPSPFSGVLPRAGLSVALSPVPVGPPKRARPSSHHQGQVFRNNSSASESHRGAMVWSSPGSTCHEPVYPFQTRIASQGFQPSGTSTPAESKNSAAVIVKSVFIFSLLSFLHRLTGLSGLSPVHVPPARHEDGPQTYLHSGGSSRSS